MLAWAWVAAALVAAPTGQSRTQKLLAVVEVRLVDADLAGAARELARVSGMSVRVRGEVPPQRATLEIKGVTVYRALVGLAELYGRPWGITEDGAEFLADPLGKEVALSLREATFPEAVKALGAATGAALSGGAPNDPERKVSLTVAGVPGRDVLDALRELYGVNAPLATREPPTKMKPPPVPAADPEPFSVLSRLCDLVQGDWGENDKRRSQLGRRFMDSVRSRGLGGLQPGGSIPFAELPASEQALALELAQRNLMLGLQHSFSGGGVPSVRPQTALTGAGISVGMTADGAELQLLVPWPGSSRPHWIVMRRLKPFPR